MNNTVFYHKKQNNKHLRTFLEFSIEYTIIAQIGI